MYQQQHRQEQEQATSGLEVDVMADSQKYGRTANLFNPATATLGKYIDSNGVEQTSSAATAEEKLNHSDYINVMPNGSYIFGSKKASGVQQTVAFVWYTSSKVLITRNTQVIPMFETDYELTAIAPNNAEYAIINYTTVNNKVMLNTGVTLLPYEPYLDWQHSLRKLTTATEAVENPLYSDGTAITVYTLKGNTVQNGTPTPSAPITVQGVGELETTGEHSGEYKIPISSGGVTTNLYLGSTQTARQIKKYELTGNETFYRDYERNDSWRFYSLPLVQSAMDTGICSHFEYIGTSGVNSSDNIGYSLFSASQFGCRFPKSIANTVNDFKAWLAQQYAAGTPVTVWYVLATEETATVNEPLMKIGNYADTLSNATAIPTTEGANSITVDTTVQPSEFTATWTGWHDASVKEKSGNLFDIEKWLTDRGISYTIVDGKYEFNTDISLNNNVYYFANDNISVSISGLIEAVTVTSPFITLVNKNGGNAKTTALSPTTIKSEDILCAGLKFNWNKGGKVRLSNIMLNTGSTALPYEPYWK